MAARESLPCSRATGSLLPIVARCGIHPRSERHIHIFERTRSVSINCVRFLSRMRREPRAHGHGALCFLRESSRPRAARPRDRPLLGAKTRSRKAVSASSNARTNSTKTDSRQSFVFARRLLRTSAFGLERAFQLLMLFRPWRTSAGP